MAHTCRSRKLFLYLLVVGLEGGGFYTRSVVFSCLETVFVLFNNLDSGSSRQGREGRLANTTLVPPEICFAFGSLAVCFMAIIDVPT